MSLKPHFDTGDVISRVITPDCAKHEIDQTTASEVGLALPVQPLNLLSTVLLGKTFEKLVNSSLDEKRNRPIQDSIMFYRPLYTFGHYQDLTVIYNVSSYVSLHYFTKLTSVRIERSVSQRKS